MIQTEEKKVVETKNTIRKTLIVWNDDVNTFQHVINCLVKICKHSPEQAEQCSMIIHYNGKCDVKNGEFDELNILKRQLEDNTLTCTIE